MRQQRFTRKFKEEAVRLARTTDRTQQTVMEDLDAGLWTLIPSMGRSRDRQAGDAGASPAAAVLAERK